MVRVFFSRVGSSSRPSFCSPLSAPPSLSSSCSSRSTWRSSCLGSDTCTATPRVCLPRPPSRPVVSSVFWLLSPLGITLWLVSWMIRTGECPSIDSTRSVILCCYLCRWRALIHAVFFPLIVSSSFPSSTSRGRLRVCKGKPRRARGLPSRWALFVQMCLLRLVVGLGGFLRFVITGIQGPGWSIVRLGSWMDGLVCMFDT